MEILFPHGKFFYGKILSRNLFPTTIKIPLENVCVLPNNQYYM